MLPSVKSDSALEQVPPRTSEPSPATDAPFGSPPILVYLDATCWGLTRRIKGTIPKFSFSAFPEVGRGHGIVVMSRRKQKAPRYR